ncbi:hypothetical protein QN362_08925 [Actimicrobium sp. CCC2.4]|uniref:hypothetical protein n=1 Tax=Actimicrobium sp. CCC2.4 TaxID=3048606 RepID=UPI002AC90352|nr:hypothetical protein [Actimicrobium sp. CCC2.4]MEB0135451.1 hypothetical protein [Actimicrobium sp. CCC2.4]WPX32375.1 hypothetical protein RHM62_00560 [Actimicrobium sp. CCC2.4]
MTYRTRRPFEGENGNGQRRLQGWIATRAALALERLARRYGVTKQTMMEGLINAEDERIMAQLSPDTPDRHAYVGK